jgi:nucleoside-diphosphate-sugar epimerase
MEYSFEDKKVLITGGAGFIGSHLVDRLMEMGAHVTVVDNFVTGNKHNIEQHLGNERFVLVEEDVVEWAQNIIFNLKFSIFKQYNHIFHLASPASPRGYMEHPVETYMVNGMGTHSLSLLAKQWGASLLFASTSEVYGDPLEHPQQETYFGNVNPIGPRACYDESKRFGEMVVMNAVRNNGLDGRMVRIFNTYGPRMDPLDGRVFPSFISQALKNEPITVYGDGLQTRSFCFVSDLVEYLLRAMAAEAARGEVINIGNPEEHTILEMAETIKRLTNSSSEIVFADLPQDDPVRRKPDISKASLHLEFEPKIGLEPGLTQTIEWFRLAI